MHAISFRLERDGQDSVWFPGWIFEKYFDFLLLERAVDFSPPASRQRYVEVSCILIKMNVLFFVVVAKLYFILIFIYSSRIISQTNRKMRGERRDLNILTKHTLVVASQKLKSEINFVFGLYLCKNINRTWPAYWESLAVLVINCTFRQKSEIYVLISIKYCYCFFWK